MKRKPEGTIFNPSKILLLLTVVLTASVNSAFAVDLSGDVATVDGTPVCAMVLASGRSMFSCTPPGPFSLEGLPLEPDGTINLQVYADGFLPYYRTLSDFGYQSVVMTPAGSCPVDDGLSGGKLDGVYRMLRTSINYNDGLILDSAAPEFEVSGTMTIMGNTLTRTLLFISDGLEVGQTISGTYVDFGYFLRFTDSSTGFNSDIVIVEKGKKLVTEVNTNAYGGDASELLQWAWVSNAASALEASTSAHVYTQSTNSMAGALAEELDRGIELKTIRSK